MVGYDKSNSLLRLCYYATLRFTTGFLFPLTPLSLLFFHSFLFLRRISFTKIRVDSWFCGIPREGSQDLGENSREKEEQMFPPRWKKKGDEKNEQRGLKGNGLVGVRLDRKRVKGRK